MEKEYDVADFKELGTAEFRYGRRPLLHAEGGE